LLASFPRNEKAEIAVREPSPTARFRGS